MSEQRNLVLATGLSIAILLGYNFFVEKPKLEKLRAEAIQAEVTHPAPAPVIEMPKSRGEVVSTGARLAIRTPSVTGSLNLKGARFDDLLLVKYFTQLDHKDNVTLLSPIGTDAPYYIEQGWLADNVRAPNGDSLWTADGKELTPETPVTLRWDNGDGVTLC